MSAGADDGNCSTKQLLVSFEIYLCFIELPEISLVGDLPPLVGGHIVYTQVLPRVVHASQSALPEHCGVGQRQI